MKKKELILSYMQRMMIESEDKLFSTQELVEHFQMQRTNLSSILNQLVKENRLEKIDGRPVLYKLVSQGDDSCHTIFQKMIGYNGSLKQAIQRVTSELMYPSQHYRFLLIGNSGVGKSFFVKTLFQYLEETHKVASTGRLFKLNCKYFLNHQNDLYELLQDDGFHKQIADGVLFVDNIHLISHDKRSLIYDFITLQTNQENFILIFSTDKMIDEDFKKNYLDSMPVIIDLPDLKDRSLNERFDIVKETLKNEAAKISRHFIVDDEVLQCLLLYPCQNNIKQLITDIKSGCAHAHLKEMKYNSQDIHIYYEDLPKYVKKGLLFYKNHVSELAFISKDCFYRFSEKSVEKIKDASLLEKNLANYSYLKDQPAASKATINDALQKYHHQIVSQNIDETSLSKIVDYQLIQMIKEFLNQASIKLNRVFLDSVLYGLCLHIQSLIDHPQTKKYDDHYVHQIMNEHPKEYVLSLQLIDTIEEKLNVHLSLEEAAFITMFLCEKQPLNDTAGTPVFLIAMHGHQTASSLVEVVKTLVKTERVYAYDLALDKDINEAYHELKELIKEMDRGKGILMMYDMGSIKTMAEEIADETGIDIRFIISPTTLIALDCARKIETTNNLDLLMDHINESYEKYFPSIVSHYKRELKKKIIITLCMSGGGGALQIKKYLEKNIDFQDIDIVPLSMKDKDQLFVQINQLNKNHHILYVVGTFDPHLQGISFISVSQIFNVPVDKLSELFSVNGKYLPTKKRMKYSLIFKNIEEQMPDFDIELLKGTLLETISKIEMKYPLDQNQKIGLIMHLSHLIDQLVHHQEINQMDDYDKVIMTNKKIYNYLYDLLSNIEEEYEITFSDADIAMMIRLIKKI